MNRPENQTFVAWILLILPRLKELIPFAASGSSRDVSIPLAVIRIMKAKVYEFLPDIEHPNKAEKQEIDKYLNEIRENVVKGGKHSDILKPTTPTITKTRTCKKLC